MPYEEVVVPESIEECEEQVLNKAWLSFKWEIQAGFTQVQQVQAVLIKFII